MAKNRGKCKLYIEWDCNFKVTSLQKKSYLEKPISSTRFAFSMTKLNISSFHRQDFYGCSLNRFSSMLRSCKVTIYFRSCAGILIRLPGHSCALCDHMCVQVGTRLGPPHRCGKIRYPLMWPFSPGYLFFPMLYTSATMNCGVLWPQIGYLWPGQWYDLCHSKHR